MIEIRCVCSAQVCEVNEHGRRERGRRSSSGTSKRAERTDTTVPQSNLSSTPRRSFPKWHAPEDTL